MSKYAIIKELEANGKKFKYFSLPDLQSKDHNISRLPFSLRIVLESVIRNSTKGLASEKDIENILEWNAKEPADTEIPFTVSRVLMQDFTGIPAIVDLASMRDTVVRLGKDPNLIEPEVPVDLVIDHSVQVNYFGDEKSFQKNVEEEFRKNGERYQFLKWAQGSMKNLRIVPPSTGIVHQVNLEYLAKLVYTKKEGNEEFAYFDSLVGTDSHTTMVNGLGVTGWGVGGIEAEAAMLGQPVTFQTPGVVGVNIHGSLRSGITATDLVLTVTEILRKANVVGKFVEFFGNGIKNLSLPDRATVSNMCPEYGATMALFPIDDETLSYLRITGRSEDQIALVKKYFEAQGLFGYTGGAEYSEIIDIDLESIVPVIAGPKLPQQKVQLKDAGRSFLKFMEESGSRQSGKGQTVQVSLKTEKIRISGREETLSEGDVVIAAITSCTNTSNPRVMVGAGLLAKKAVEKGLTVSPKVKTSLAPGSRVVTSYLEQSGLQKYLDELGFYLVGYGCTTCIGNSGPLPEVIEKAIDSENLSTVAVLSGNRNFEARIHKSVKANYLMSPPLVVAFALAGKIIIDMEKEPIGSSKDGKPVYLRDIWPSENEITDIINKKITESMYESNYNNLGNFSEMWNKLKAPSGDIYKWDEKSTYIRNPPFFQNFAREEKTVSGQFSNLSVLAVLGDSVTTDHISPAGNISKDSPAGKYLIAHGVTYEDFNSFGSRRGNHEVMMRGTFGNNRIQNLLVDKQGPYTKLFPSGEVTWLFDASEQYSQRNLGSIVFAGKEYGTGSSRDWAAKGPYLLGVKAVVAESYERIHRSNLVGMGVLPLQFLKGRNFKSLNIDPSKPVNIIVDNIAKPSSKAKLTFTNKNGKESSEELISRLDTEIECKYFGNGGILQFVMRRLISR
ncbi:MAG: aconitate hydratase AcnA [Candidatus Thermoplasmatota archaeon]|nr:aconitate hydratase AcnA [Candidatus Thermoplasmatota archaeon]